MQNPYETWSPEQARSETSSSEMEFGTAREYNNSSEFFNESSWWYDESLTGGTRGTDESKDKFVTSTHSGMEFDKEGAGSGAVDSCGSPLCDCCKGGGKKGNPNGAVYERYKIMDDSTEILYEFGVGGENKGDLVLEGDPLRDAGLKELEIVASYMADSSALASELLPFLFVALHISDFKFSYILIKMCYAFWRSDLPLSFSLLHVD